MIVVISRSVAPDQVTFLNIFKTRAMNMITIKIKGFLNIIKGKTKRKKHGHNADKHGWIT